MNKQILKTLFIRSRSKGAFFHGPYWWCTFIRSSTGENDARISRENATNSKLLSTPVTKLSSY